MQSQSNKVLDYILSLKAQKLSDQEIKEKLMGRGATEEKADKYMKRYHEIIAAQLRRDGLKDIGIGLAFLVVGVIVSIFTYQLAVSIRNGRPLVTVGLIIWGVIQFGRGVWKLLRGVWDWQ